MKRKLVSLALASFLLFAFIPSVPAANGIITFVLRPADGTPDTLSPGDNFTMEVYLSNPAGTSIGSISGLTVNFNAAAIGWGIDGEYMWYTNMPFSSGEVSTSSRLTLNPPFVIFDDAADHPFGSFNAHFNFDSIVDYTDTGGVLMTFDFKAKDAADFSDISISIDGVSTFNDTILIRGIDFVVAPERTASSWAHTGINEALRKGFLPFGLRDNYTDIITRAEFCRMAVGWVEYFADMKIDALLAERGLIRDGSAFTDTADPDILAAFALGITSGRGGGLFDPNGQFTREQAAVMVMNTVRVFVGEEDIPDSTFADIDTAEAWARPGIGFVQASGIMAGTGENKFSPKNTYTREQSVVTFNNIYISPF
jgi:hypothetical protein